MAVPHPLTDPLINTLTDIVDCAGTHVPSEDTLPERDKLLAKIYREVYESNANLLKENPHKYYKIFSEQVKTRIYQDRF